MSRITRIILALVALVAAVGTTELQAQACSGTSTSQDCTISAQIRVLATLSCATTRHFDFGTTTSAGGSIESSELNHGRMRCTTDVGNTVAVSFILPATLSDGAGHTVPITYGAESARLYDSEGGGIAVEFNPAVGASRVINSGVATVALGENGPNGPSFGVFVDATGATPGTYTGAIQATIALQ